MKKSTNENNAAELILSVSMQYYYLKLPVLHFRKGDDKKKNTKKNHVLAKIRRSKFSTLISMR